ncbi:hypothetical protein [Nonomuraea sp. SBT364]|uniref:hypothetical protein n=1 Tax=Nonomuraea sp. SBT364 TaxID=1580530 RepID=UPI00066DBB3A|nr:hypothetical protein [Nonomuraea sp. SBT364]
MDFSYHEGVDQWCVVVGVHEALQVGDRGVEVGDVAEFGECTGQGDEDCAAFGGWSDVAGSLETSGGCRLLSDLA